MLVSDRTQLPYQPRLARHSPFRVLSVAMAFIAAPTTICAQESGAWILRLGAIGSATSDEGIWNFKASSGLGPQVFEFSNSWGAAVTGERVVGRHLRLGLHIVYATTDFALTVTPTDGGSPSISRDQTSYAPILGEIQFAVLPTSRVNPRLGLTAGKFFTRDVQLRTEPSAPLVDYEFEDPIIVGFGIGVDVRLGDSGVWLLSFDMKSTRYEYTLVANDWVDPQTLLNQDATLAFDHLVFSLGRSF